MGLEREIYTAEPLLPEPSAFEVDLAIEKLRSQKSPGIDQISAELIKAVGGKFRSEIHKIINSVWNKEEMSEEWKELIFVSIYTEGDKADWSKCTDLPLLTTRYKILSNILLSRLTPCAEEIIWDHQCGF